MASWTIKGIRTVESQPQTVDVALVKELEYHGEWMGEEYVTVTVKSAVPVEFRYGDYLTYRGEDFLIDYDPNVIKRARANTYGEGFVYDNIKLYSLARELNSVAFKDYVLNWDSPSNENSYSSQDKFSFFAGSVEDLADRIQANLDRAKGRGTWKVYTHSSDRTAQRLGISPDAPLPSDYSGYYPSGNMIVGKTDVSVNADIITCTDALTACYEQFGVSFITNGRTIIIGSDPAQVNRNFMYGKDNGLYEIERTTDESEKVVTRLSAYGSSNNLPLNYYANLGKRVMVPIIFKNTREYIVGVPTYIIWVDKAWDDNLKRAFWGDKYIVTLTFNDTTAKFMVGHDTYTYGYEQYDGSLSHVKDYMYFYAIDPLTTEQLAIYNAVQEGSSVEMTGVNINEMPSEFIDVPQGYNYPSLLTISNVMLPGFPDMSLYTWVKEHKDAGTSTDDTTGLATYNGVTAYFSKDPENPWIQSLRADEIGVREGTVYFDGSGDMEEIMPSIENTGADEVVVGSDVTDNGYLNSADDTFTITVNDELDWQELLNTAPDSNNVTVSMKTGFCTGREFKVNKADKDEANEGYVLTLERQKDGDRYFPYSDNSVSGYCQIKGEDSGESGDRFVVLGISLPKSYVDAASVKVLKAALEALCEVDHSNPTYLPKIDEIFMARNYDAVVNNDPEGIIEYGSTNLHDTFRAGLQMQVTDADLDIQILSYIDNITIKENGNNGIPTYDVVLRNKKDESVFKKLEKKIVDLSQGGISTKGGTGGTGSGSGGTGSPGGEYLSKTNDDEARGVIGFLKGLWVGAKKWYFDLNGDLSANNGKFAGYLEVNGDATVNNIGSDNYTGEGITDTGWHITSGDGSGSHAVFDYLTIRKKMIVNSLEIKETHFTAGDIAQSCASAEIARTDYFGVNLLGEYYLLGYSSVKVPWLLRKMAMILGMDNGLVRSMYARHKIVRLTLSEEDLKKVRVVRCYFLAKDGEKSVENWWRVDDLARCQTWNVTQYSRKTFTFEDFKVHGGNVYWWRKVKDVSWNTGEPRYLLADADNNPLDPSNPSNITTNPDYYIEGGKRVYKNEAGIKYQVTNGTYHPPVEEEEEDSHAPAVIDGKTYHWFDVEYDYLQEQGGQAHGWCDANSDIPAAGDKVVQFGNSTDPDRMNVTLSEVNGAGNLDAPDIKIFRGIYTFNLEESWWGGVPCKMKLSPATGYDFYGPHFRFTTEYGTARVPLDRPEKYWTNIGFEYDEYWKSKPGYVAPDYSDDIYSGGQFVSRADGIHGKDYVRKCRYYDRVSHNGSLWLCSMANESWYWRATANIPGTAYSEGDVVTNYASLTDEQKAYCEHVRNYTNQEPTPASGDWTKQVDKGENSFTLALDNEHEDFLYSKSGLVAPANGATSQATLYDGANPVAANNVTWKVSLNGGMTYNDSGSSAQTGSVADGWISSTGLLTVTGIKVDAAEVYVKAIYPRENGEEYFAKFTANRTEQDKFDIVVKPNAVSFNISDAWTDKNIRISANCTSLNGGFTENYELKNSAANGLRLYYAYVDSSGTIGTLSQVTSSMSNVTFDSTNNKFTFTLGQTPANANSGIYFELRYYTGSSYRMCDYETVEIAKTENGSGGSDMPYIEFSRNIILYDADGSGHAEGAQEFALTYTLKVGGHVCTVPDASYILISTPTGVSIKNNTKTTTGCTFVVANNATPTGNISFVITGTYDGVNYTAESPVAVEPNKRGDDGDDSVVYSLECSPDVVNFRSNAVGDIPSTSQTVTIAMKKTVGNNAPETVTDKYLHYRKYGLASSSATTPSWGSWTQVTNGQYVVSSNDALSGIIMEVEFCISSVSTGVSDSNILCRKTVPVILDGKKGVQGNTGRMFYSAGEWSNSVTYQRTDVFVPMVYYNDGVWNPNLEMYGSYYYLNADSAYGNNDEPGTSSKWVLCNDYAVVITQALFASFAKLGGFIVSGDFFFSQYGILVSRANTYNVLSPSDTNKSYKLGPNDIIQDSISGGNGYRKAYTYFDAADPFAEYVISGSLKFKPALCINSVTGEMYVALGNFRVDASGNVDIEGTVRTKLFYAATKTVTSDNYKIDLDNDPYYTYFKEPGNTNYRVKLPDPADYEGVELRFFSPIAPGGSSQNVMRVYWPNGTINLCLDTGISEVTAVALQPFRMGTLKVIGGEWWTIDDGFVAAVV